MAMRGLKPVVEIQFFDYIWPAMMQIRDEMTMMRYRSGNSFSCPMVDARADRRLPARRRTVPQPVGREHLRALPGHPHRVSRRTRVDAAGLLRTAIRCDDPVLFLEHKHLYRQTYNKGEYPGKDFMIPFGKASLRREGDDVLVDHVGRARAAVAAGRAAGGEGWHQRRGARPADDRAVRLGRRSPRTSKRTNRVVVAHEDQVTCGFGAEIAARIAGELFEHLDAPVRRVGALDTPGRLQPRPRGSDPAAVADILKAIRETARY